MQRIITNGLTKPVATIAFKEFIKHLSLTMEAKTVKKAELK